MNPPTAPRRRTLLARQRTALAMMILGIALIKVGLAHGVVLEVVASACVVLAGATALLLRRVSAPGRAEVVTFGVLTVGVAVAGVLALVGVIRS